MAFLMAAGLVLAIFAFAMAERGESTGVAISLCILSIISAEILGVPEILLDRRVALSGQPFSRSLSLLLAPHGRLLVVLVIAAGVLAERDPAALALFAAAAVLIASRLLMKIAWHERPGAATRDGFLLAAGAGLAYALLGPLALALLPVLPVWFYVAAKRRVERA